MYIYGKENQHKLFNNFINYYPFSCKFTIKEETELKLRMKRGPNKEK